MERIAMSKDVCFNLLAIIVLSVSLTSCDDGTQPPPQESTHQKIPEVTDVQLSVLESDPLQLNITAKGNVSSSGWTKPELVPFVYVAPPQDGIYDFDFNAVPPSGASATVITPIETTYRLSPLPDTLKGVRIYAVQNKKEAMIEPKVKTE